MSNIQNKVIIQSDDLKFDGKNIIIPSYYDGVICDYLNHVDVKGMDDANHQDYLEFRRFFEAIMDYKANKGGN